MIYHPYDPGTAEHNSFTDLEDVVAMVVRELRRVANRFDAIAVSGVSGMAVGFPAALNLDKPILVLRKETEDSHGNHGELIGRRMLHDSAAAGEPTRVLFLDDFVAGGRTRKRVADAVTAEEGVLVGEFLYGQPEYNDGNRLHWAPDWQPGWDSAVALSS